MEGPRRFAIEVPFADALPATYQGYRVIDGNENDLRFEDPTGVIVGLTYKTVAHQTCGAAVASGFVKLSILN